MDFKIVYERSTRGFKHLLVKVLYNENSHIAVVLGTVESITVCMYDPPRHTLEVWNVIATTLDHYTKAIDWGIEIIDQWFTKWELEQETSKNAE